jgi:mono/diheme cytochrome c family protein
MKLRTFIFTGVVSFAVALPLQSQNPQPTSSTTAKPAKDTTTTGEKVHDGQKVFEQNCERCHSAPQGFSPSISGTVSKHMRARANLSKTDMDALLRFLNP